MNIYICIEDSFRQVDTLAIGEMLSVFEPIHRRVGIGTGKFLAWIIGKGVAPHITVRDQSQRDDGTFSRSDFRFDKERNIYVCPAGKLLKTTGLCVPRTSSALIG